MGSRRRRHAALIPALAALAAACAIGAPPGFSPGDTWTFPLVEPLAEGRLITPVIVEGKGPYLFALDPDAPITIVDPEVVARGEFLVKTGPRRVDEHDVSHPTRYTTLTNVRIGTLAISLLEVAVSDAQQFDAEGRRIQGVLGHDVIADSLVFSFDRDRGIAWLTTQETFHPPPGAQVVEYTKAFLHEMAIPRRMVAATVDGVPHELHADLGDAPSQLDPRHWLRARLQEVATKLTLIDETGTSREVHRLGIAQNVVAGPIARTDLAFAPYDDRRFYQEQVDGTLGLNFFRPYVVHADWHHERFYLVPRQDARTIRLARWDDAVCRDAACVHVELLPPSGPPPADQRPALRVTREGDRNLEVVLAASGAGPNASALPMLEVDFAAGEHAVEAPIDAGYLGSTLAIVDVSPFPRRCPMYSPCVLIERPPVP